MLSKIAERNIKNIIINTYEEEAKFQDEDFDDFYIFVSTINAYGYSIDEIEEFATKYGIDINPDDGDPDDEYDMGGSLEVNRAKIDELKKLQHYHEIYCPDYIPNWNDKDELKWCVFFNKSISRYQYLYDTYAVRPNEIYFDSEETVRKVCDRLHENL